MGHSLAQPARPARGITAEDRMELPGQLTPRQQTDALLWLAGYAPASSTRSPTPSSPSPATAPTTPLSILRTLRSRHRHLTQARPGPAALPRGQDR